MTSSGLIKIILLTTCTLLFVFGCASKPEEEVAEDVVETVKPAPEETPAPAEKVEMVQEEVDTAMARSAVRRANAMGANQYFPAEYRQLVEDLNAAEALVASDPVSAVTALENVEMRANALHDKTLETRKKAYIDKYMKNDSVLKDQEADKYAPAEYSAIQSMASEVQDLYEAGELNRAREKADETLQTQARLYYNLNENLRYTAILERDTVNYLSDAEDNEAFIYAPEELNAANDLYNGGMAALKNYNLEESVSLLSAAKAEAVRAAQVSAVRKKQAETDDLMTSTQKRLEEISTLRVENPDGSITQAEDWEGEDYLARNPLIDHSENIEAVEIEQLELRELDAPVDNLGGPSDIPIETEGTQVNADEQDTNYLESAKKLWERGVNARNDGQFDLANDYFRQAQAYIDAYEANAISKTYTVVYRKKNTDSLWIIAERDDIFGDPFLWPKLWRANKRIIQNPDLIYPGQVLSIPPK